tara:strand:+ start:179 stop:898 length:720 start_codon:yes stop_codon:yes gene_type:complete
MLENIRKNYSPNFYIKKRKPGDIEFIIIHYTGMKSEKLALKKLTSLNSNVSCHYLINYSGIIINLVPDLYTSWHAGKSRWGKKKSLNINSIGIEISNPGHENTYNRFKKKQINSLIYLISILKKKYKIKNVNILGHSDIAPDRKKDPGEKFPWKLLYKKKISIWHDIKEKTLKKYRNKTCCKAEIYKFYNNLKKIGYNTKNKTRVIKAFQRRFRQTLISGKIDKECLFISISLVKIFKH